LEPTHQPPQPVNEPQSQHDSKGSTSSLLDRSQSLLIRRKVPSSGVPTPIPTFNPYEVLNNGPTDGHASAIKHGVVESTAPSAIPPHAPHQEVKIREVSSSQRETNNSSVTGPVKVIYSGGRHTHRLKLVLRQHNWSSALNPRFKAFVDCDRRSDDYKRTTPEALLLCYRKECSHNNCSRHESIERCFSDHVETWPQSVQLELFREVFSMHHHPDYTFERLR
jgi:hypothetical protein